MIIHRFDSLGKYTGRVITNQDGLDNEDLSRVYVGDVNMKDNFHDIATGLPMPKGVQPSSIHVFDYTLKQWSDPRTLQEVKDQTWTQIKQARSQAEYAGFTWDGSTFDSDAISQNRITGAVTLAQMSTAFSIAWVLANNSVRTLNQVDMLQVGAALGNHVAEQFSKGVVLRELITAAVSKEEVEAITWASAVQA